MLGSRSLHTPAALSTSTISQCNSLSFDFSPNNLLTIEYLSSHRTAPYHISYIIFHRFWHSTGFHRLLSIPGFPVGTVTQTHLFVFLGGIYAHAEGLGAFVSLGTRQTVEARVGVDTALHSTHFVADVGHHVALRREQRGRRHGWGRDVSECREANWGDSETEGTVLQAKDGKLASLMSSQWVPFPRKPLGHGPHSQEPSGELLQSTPPKHGFERQPSAQDLKQRQVSLQELKTLHARPTI